MQKNVRRFAIATTAQKVAEICVILVKQVWWRQSVGRSQCQSWCRTDDQEPETRTLRESRRGTKKVPRLATQFMRADQPKFLTKAELREAAMRELKVSKNSFDFGWISAIEETRALRLA